MTVRVPRTIAVPFSHLAFTIRRRSTFVSFDADTYWWLMQFWCRSLYRRYRCCSTQPLDQGDLFGKNISTCVCVLRRARVQNRTTDFEQKYKRNMVKCTFGCWWPLLHTYNQRTKATDPNDKMNNVSTAAGEILKGKKKKIETKQKHSTHLRKIVTSLFSINNFWNRMRDLLQQNAKMALLCDCEKNNENTIIIKTKRELATESEAFIKYWTLNG